MRHNSPSPAIVAPSGASSPPAPLARWLENRWFLALWCIAAAFGAYACMYGFRKPFTAATFGDGPFGTQLKSWYVASQVIGYMISKFAGIKIIAEMTPGRRAGTLLLLIGGAETALLLFALVPAPYNAACLLLNGLPLGLVFGLVLGFLEGRRMTELFVAGLCASFILADGATKSVGSWLLSIGVAEHWMPFTAGALFAAPLCGFVWMLRHIPAPNSEDVAARAAREPMSASDRGSFLRRHGSGLALILLAYLLITVLRSVRADFAPEIWQELGLQKQPSIYAQSELWVAIGVLAINGMLVLIGDNRRALLMALGLAATALAMAMVALALHRAGHLAPFAFMVALGMALYVPYVAVHTAIFERLVALTRERANIGFLMYLADAVGYMGYAGVMLGRSTLGKPQDFLGFFLPLCDWLAAIAAAALLAAAVVEFRRPRSASAIKQDV